MATKLLKLKPQLTEVEAATLLSSLLGEEVTSSEMVVYAQQGIIPAYIEMDQSKYPGACFHLIEHREYLELGSREVPTRLRPTQKRLPAVGDSSIRFWHELVPYPLLKSRTSDEAGEFEYSLTTDANGTRWVVFAAPVVDGYLPGHGPLERVTDEHVVRVYTPQLIFQIAQILSDASTCPVWPAVAHPRTSVERMGGFNGFDDDWAMPLISPYEEEVEGRSRSAPDDNDSSRFDSRERDTYKRLVYVLAKKAGLKLEKLGADEKGLLEY